MLTSTQAMVLRALSAGPVAIPSGRGYPPGLNGNAVHRLMMMGFVKRTDSKEAHVVRNRRTRRLESVRTRFIELTEAGREACAVKPEAAMEPTVIIPIDGGFRVTRQADGEEPREAASRGLKDAFAELRTPTE